MTQESVGESQAGFAADLARLKNHQKSRKGAPLYSLYINRPIGRYIAAAAATFGMTPNQVSIISAFISWTAIVLAAALRPTPATAALVVALLLLGYAVDSADGQLARLRSGGSLAGEWLDHCLDVVKVSALHLAVLISAQRFDADLGAWPQVAAFAFELVAVTGFFTFILTEQLRRRAPTAPAPTSPGGMWRVLMLPTDWGVQCLWLIVRPASTLFFVGYGALAAANGVHLVATTVRRWRWFRDVDRREEGMALP
ncbi:MAG: CDP-alcohol phosphatidyltransferase family protein [Actinobacteria bacterium]|nr:CDP-alcohol phosphatidyltransferase family protein [Actinomycetota bacterium]